MLVFLFYFMRALCGMALRYEYYRNDVERLKRADCSFCEGLNDVAMHCGCDRKTTRIDIESLWNDWARWGSGEMLFYDTVKHMKI